MAKADTSNDEAVSTQAMSDDDVTEAQQNQPQQHSTVSLQEARMSDEGVMLDWLNIETEDVSELYNRVVQAEYDEAHREGGPRSAVVDRCNELREQYKDQFPGKPA